MYIPELGKRRDSFRWPSEEDLEAVKVPRTSVLATDVVIERMSNGKLWVIKNAAEIDKEFKNMTA